MPDRHQRIVVTIVSVLDTYPGPLLNSAADVLNQHGISLVVHAEASHSPEIPPALVCLLHNPSTCGVIFTPTASAERDVAMHALIKQRALPVVYVSQVIPGESCVGADNAHGMAAVMRLLLDDCGVRAPVLVQGHPHQVDHVTRETVFRTEIARRGMCVDEDLLFPGQSTTELIKRQLGQLIKRRPDLDAVVTLDDACGVVAVEALLESGRQVPQDVVVTGFDNYPMAMINWPSLTTVDQRLAQQGTAAARMMMERLAGRAAGEHVLIPCDLIPRGSTAVGRAAHAGTPPTVQSVTRLAHVHLTAQSELLRLGRQLIKCRTLAETCQSLPEIFSALGIRRAFLVIYEQADRPVTAHGLTHQAARLVLRCAGGHADPVPDIPFSSCQLLPDDLLCELHRGLLAFQPLNGPNGILGYLLLEYAFGSAAIIESLAMGLSRTLDAVFSTTALQAHSTVLEQLIDQRTEELVKEISVRRQIELDLRRANTELQRSALIDGLTGIANRAALERHLAEQWNKNPQELRELAILTMDVDMFKLYNDHYGHLLGDETLRTVACCLNGACRYPYDLACRFGGEEFIAVLPHSDERDALRVASRFTRLLTEAAIPHAVSPVAPIVTVSVGISVVTPGADTTPEEAVAAADTALYRAKAEGRNRIAIATPENLRY